MRTGQRYPTPEDTDGTRVFYETMFQENPQSKMAEKWLMENGCLSDEKQTTAFKKYKAK